MIMAGARLHMSVGECLGEGGGGGVGTGCKQGKALIIATPNAIAVNLWVPRSRFSI